MQEGYFKTCWNDIKSSPNWFGKIILLGLTMLIPIFGAIAVGGYLYGWARDIAWGVKNPLPKHIFGNEDGKQYSRGFYLLVLAIVLGLIPMFFQSLWDGITGANTSSTYSVFSFSGLVGSIIYVVLLLATLIFGWVGSMRIAIYDRLGPGFQFGKVWAMMRHDSNGLLRIFGMYVVLEVIVCVALLVIYMIAMGVVIALCGGIDALALSAGSSAYYGSTYGYGGYEPSGSAVAILLAILAIIAVEFILILPLSVFCEAMIARALGYWTRQFEVCNWRGQDDPMPFEVHAAAAANAVPVAPVQSPDAQVGAQPGAPAGQPVPEQAPQSWDYPATAAPGTAPLPGAGVPSQGETTLPVSEQHVSSEEQTQVTELAQAEPVQLVEPAQATTPIQPEAPAQAEAPAAEPIESAEPSEPAEPTEVAGPTETAEFSEAAEPTQPAGPIEAAQPSDSSESPITTSDGSLEEKPTAQ